VPWSAPPACGAKRSCAAAIRCCGWRACAAISIRASPSWTARSRRHHSRRAGLKRLGWAHVSARCCRGAKPARRAGALAIEYRAERGDIAERLAALNHRATELAVRAERAVSRALGAVAAAARRLRQRKRIDPGTARPVANPDGMSMVRARFPAHQGRPRNCARLAGELRAARPTILAALL